MIPSEKIEPETKQRHNAHVLTISHRHKPKCPTDVALFN